MIEFSYPIALYGLILVGVWWIICGLEGRYVLYLSASQGKSTNRRWIRLFLGTTVITSILLALAQPVQLQKIEYSSKNGIDILLVVDLSKSMLAEDILPSRLSVARSALSNFVSSRTSDRIALIGFAGKPFLMSPLTDDREGLQSIISLLGVDSIRQELAGLSGTAIGDALLLGTESLSDRSRERVMILLTDGEANVGIDPRAATVYTKEAGIRTYTIGLGSTKGTDLYTTDANGRKQYFLDSSGVPIKARVDEALMRYIADTTSGVYANALSST